MTGSSPRVRGTAKTGKARLTASRFIPACAGNSRSAISKISRRTVHPRVCGEQLRSLGYTVIAGGSSPRVRGTGSLSRSRPYSRRFIPACAGNRLTALMLHGISPVHPRVCGEQNPSAPDPRIFSGSSPRVRGTDGHPGVVIESTRFIPACAGNRRAAVARGDQQSVHPRVCGEQHQRGTVCVCDHGSSPRVRGTARSSRTCCSL